MVHKRVQTNADIFTRGSAGFPVLCTPMSRSSGDLWPPTPPLGAALSARSWGRDPVSANASVTGGMAGTPGSLSDSGTANHHLARKDMWLERCIAC